MELYNINLNLLCSNNLHKYSTVSEDRTARRQITSPRLRRTKCTFSRRDCLEFRSKKSWWRGWKGCRKFFHANPSSLLSQEGHSRGQRKRKRSRNTGQAFVLQHRGQLRLHLHLEDLPRLLPHKDRVSKPELFDPNISSNSTQFQPIFKPFFSLNFSNKTNFLVTLIDNHRRNKGTMGRHIY